MRNSRRKADILQPLQEPKKKAEYTVPPPTPEEYILLGLQLMKEKIDSQLKKIQSEYIQMLWENVEEWVKSEKEWLKLADRLKKVYCECKESISHPGLKSAIEKLLLYARCRKKFLGGQERLK